MDLRFVCLLSLVALIGAPVRASQGAPKSQGPAGEIAVGQQLFEAGRFEQAEKQFELAVAKTPNDAGAWNWLGQSRFAQKLWAKAGDAFTHAQTLAPSDTTVLGNIGVCQYSLQQNDLASASFARAIKLDAGFSRGHMYLARIAAERGDDAGAEKEFALAVGSPDCEPLAPFYFGLYLFQMRRLDEAVAQFERCLALSPDMPGAHLNLALIYQRRGEAARAELELRRFRELTEVEIENRAVQMRVAHLLTSANKEIEADHIDAALAAALEALEVAPEAPVVHQFVARIYTLQGRTADAARENERFRALSDKAAGK